MTPGEIANAEDDLRRAEAALRVGRIALDIGAREDAASRLYYAAFHACRSALIVRGLHARTHAGQIALFEQTYGASPVLGRALDWRIRADYDERPFAPSAEELSLLADEVSAFVERCRACVEEFRAGGSDEPDPPPDL